MANATTDHEEIRRWAESKGGKPAAVDRTHGGSDVGIIRIMFPDQPQSEHGALVEISWDEFFDQFEESQLALLYDEGSMFNKIVGRDTLEHREHGEHTSRRQLREESRAGGGRSGAGSEHRSEQKQPERNEKRGGEPREPQSAEGSKAGAGDDADLKSREYRDAQGEVHHHTRSYMEQHGRKE